MNAPATPTVIRQCLLKVTQTARRRLLNNLAMRAQASPLAENEDIRLEIVSPDSDEPVLRISGSALLAREFGRSARLGNGPASRLLAALVQEAPDDDD